jgi:hypothetical protein
MIGSYYSPVTVSRRWTTAGLVGAGVVALVVLAAAPARTPGTTSRTGHARVAGATAPAVLVATLIATPPVQAARTRPGLPTCPESDRPYPPSTQLRATGPSSLYFVNSSAPAGWRIDVPDLGITSHDFDDPPPDQIATVVYLYARDFENSQAGPHTATLTWPASTPGAHNCKYPFWLKHASKLSMTVTQSGGTRRITGRLTQAMFGRDVRNVGNPGQRIQIRYRVGRKYVYLRTVTTEADGSYTMTVTAKQHIWQAIYAGISTANGLRSHEVTG